MSVSISPELLQSRNRIYLRGTVSKELRTDKQVVWLSKKIKDGIWLQHQRSNWGRPHLTREFFYLVGEKMGDKVILIVVEHDDKLIAGALNLIGGDTLFGRLWGYLPDAYFHNLYFEACYYQAIEAAIELNLRKVEASAQGEHKIQRDYLPVTTYSCHYFSDPCFAAAIGNFLARETAQVKHVIKALHGSGRTRKTSSNNLRHSKTGSISNI